MAWLLLLGIFWKPVYYVGMFIYKKVKKQDASYYWSHFGYWFVDLFALVMPEKD